MPFRAMIVIRLRPEPVAARGHPGQAGGAVAMPDEPDAPRQQIQVDVAVLATDEPGRPRRVLSLGEAKWGKIMGLRHLDRLRRARDLLSVRGYDTGAAELACYSGAGFDKELSAAARTDSSIRLIGLGDLYAD